MHLNAGACLPVVFNQGSPFLRRSCEQRRSADYSLTRVPAMNCQTFSKKQECRTCKKVYANGDGTEGGMRQLVRRKRLLEDPGTLLVSKKMRLKYFAPENHSVLQGARCLNILEVLKATEEAGEAETVLPEDCRLSRDRAGALAYPCEVVTRRSGRWVLSFVFSQ